MLQTATCISVYEPMSDLVKVGDRCEIDTIHAYVGEDGVTYVEVYRPSNHKIGDMPLRHFSLADDPAFTLVSNNLISFDKFGHSSYGKKRAVITLESTTKLTTKPPKMYDVRLLSNERIAEMIAAVKKSTK